jgi:hypothetical protein
MLDMTDSMELDENRIAKPLARPRASASAISAEGAAGTSAPSGLEEAEYPPLSPVVTPVKATTRQRRSSRADEPDAADVAAQMALSALTEPEPNQPKAKRNIGLGDHGTATENPAPEAVPKGALQVRSRRLQRTQSDASEMAHTLHRTHCQLATEPIQPAPEPPPRKIEQPVARDTRLEHAAAPSAPKVAHKRTHSEEHPLWWDQASKLISQPNDDRMRACQPPTGPSTLPLVALLLLGCRPPAQMPPIAHAPGTWTLTCLNSAPNVTSAMHTRYTTSHATHTDDVVPQRSDHTLRASPTPQDTATLLDPITDARMHTTR